MFSHKMAPKPGKKYQKPASEGKGSIGKKGQWHQINQKRIRNSVTAERHEPGRVRLQ
jgi:hypothetical protein